MYVSGKKLCEISKGLEGLGRSDCSVRCAWGLAHEAIYCKTESTAVVWAAIACCVVKTDCCIYIRKLCFKLRQSLFGKANISTDRHQRCVRSMDGNPVKNVSIGRKGFRSLGTGKLLALTAAIRFVLCSLSSPLALLTLDLFQAQALQRVRVEPSALLSSFTCMKWSRLSSMSLARERAIVITVGRETAG